MIIREAKLETVCGITSTLPENEYTEIAFAGKSNVGKSSLINALMNRKNLARTSSEPGKTQTINFYRIDGLIKNGEEKIIKDLYFVDLPGYGYARASKNEVEKWGRMIENYLKKSQKLKAVFLLIDIRHEPGSNDVQMYDWVMANGYKPIIIATKSDKIKRSQLDKQKKIIRTKLGASGDTIIIPCSAQSKDGMDKVHEVIESLID